MSRTQIAKAPPRDAYERNYERNMKAFSVSYMSNAKWYKVFQAIASAHLGITRATWKFMWILFPRVFECEVFQDIEGLIQVLEAVGQFQTIADERGLTIFGYGGRR